MCTLHHAVSTCLCGSHKYPSSPDSLLPLNRGDSACLHGALRLSVFGRLKVCATHRGQELKKELTLAGSSDITVAITEPQTGQKEVTLPVKVRQP